MLGFFSRQVCSLLELLRLEFLEVAEEDDEKEFHANTNQQMIRRDQVDSTYRSFVIIKSPWTSKPFEIWGAMPLKSPNSPSF